jgi:hypothetical protein
MRIFVSETCLLAIVELNDIRGLRMIIRAKSPAGAYPSLRSYTGARISTSRHPGGPEWL